MDILDDIYRRTVYSNSGTGKVAMPRPAWDCGFYDATHNFMPDVEGTDPSADDYVCGYFVGLYGDN